MWNGIKCMGPSISGEWQLHLIAHLGCLKWKPFAELSSFLLSQYKSFDAFKDRVPPACENGEG